MLKEIQTLLTILIMASSFPVGYLLAWLCRDELVSERKYFKIISTASIVLAFVFLLLINIEEKFVIVMSLIYIGVVSLISETKSYDKKFVK